MNKIPQAWLPIGKRVCATTDKKLYAPIVYVVDGGYFYTTRDGVVIEHLRGGGIAVKFDGYSNTVYYSEEEAARFV
mgnify:CR=1 FL=1